MIKFLLTSLEFSVGSDHGLINYIDTKAKMSLSKKSDLKGPCGRGLPEFIDWRYSQSC
jgi:hypothetical protein